MEKNVKRGEYQEVNSLNGHVRVYGEKQPYDCVVIDTFRGRKKFDGNVTVLITANNFVIVHQPEGEQLTARFRLSEVGRWIGIRNRQAVT